MSSPGVLPPAFPAPFPDNVKSIRFYETGLATGDYGDNSFAFERVNPKDPAEPEQGWCTQVQVRAIGGDLNISFDGVTVEGDLIANESMNFFTFRHKVIYLRGQAGGEPYRLWAW